LGFTLNSSKYDLLREEWRGFNGRRKTNMGGKKSQFGK
jgi:hypothetical protein